jgi:hypothetical protein
MHDLFLAAWKQFHRKTSLLRYFHERLIITERGFVAHRDTPVVQLLNNLANHRVSRWKLRDCSKNKLYNVSEAWIIISLMYCVIYTKPVAMENVDISIKVGYCVTLPNYGLRTGYIAEWASRRAVGPRWFDAVTYTIV